MKTVWQLLISVFSLNADNSEDAHSHLEALHGDSALIERVIKLRDLELELAQAESLTGL